MEQIITSFFLKNNYCPFPGLGSLSLSQLSAQLKTEDHQISAPKPLISFSSTESDASLFIESIARKGKLNKEMATDQLTRFCNHLQGLDNSQKAVVEGLGFFYKNNLGQLQFEQYEIEEIFLPNVTAKRVVHPTDSHDVLVGDKTVSSDMIKDEIPADTSKPKSKLLVTILVLTILLAAASFATLWFADEVEQATGIHIPIRIR